MKRHFLTTMIAGLAGVAFLATSCEQTESLPDPVFPDYVEKNVDTDGQIDEDGQYFVTFDITANQAWSVSISAAEAGEYFRLMDNGFESLSVRGEAGEHTINVAVTKEKDFSNHEVTLTMTMGSQSQAIGKVILPAAERYLNVYAAALNVTEDDFVTEGGVYTYGTDALESNAAIELIWPESLITVESAPYRHSLKVDASVAWNISEKPEWLKVSVASGQAGTTEINLSCNLSDVSLDRDLSGTLAISGEGLADQTFTVRVAALELPKFVGIPSDNILRFDADGKYLSPASASPLSAFVGTVASAEEFKYYYVTSNGYANWVYECGATGATLVTITDDFENNSGTAAHLRSLTITLSENPDEELRTVTLLAIPVSEAENITDPVGDITDLYETGKGNIKTEYKDNIFATIEQEAKKKTIITVEYTAEHSTDINDTETPVVLANVSSMFEGMSEDELMSVLSEAMESGMLDESTAMAILEGRTVYFLIYNAEEAETNNGILSIDGLPELPDGGYRAFFPETAGFAVNGFSSETNTLATEFSVSMNGEGGAAGASATLTVNNGSEAALRLVCKRNY